MFWYLFLLLALFLFTYIVLIPFLQLLMIKLKFGNKAILILKPGRGLITVIQRSQKNHKDAMFSIREMIKANKDAEIILANIAFSPTIIFLNPKDYKEIMINHQNYSKLSPVPDDRVISQGLVFTEGQQWKKQRMLLGQTFNYDELKKSVPLINDVICQEISKLKKDQITAIKPTAFFEGIIGEIILLIFFGDEIRNQRFQGVPAPQYVISIIYEQISFVRSSPRYVFLWLLLKQKFWHLFPDQNQKKLYEKTSLMKKEIGKLIKKRLEEKMLQQSIGQNREAKDFLDIHLDYYLNENPKKKKEDEKITLEEITHQSLTMLFAGTDTTTQLLSTSLYFLVKFPEIQEELKKEIDQVNGEKAFIDHAQLKDLILMNSFIYECMRVKPVVNSLLTRKAKVQHQIKGITIKKGWYINYFIPGTSEREEFFESPQQFNHRRWLNGKGLNASVTDTGFAFVPFSAGPRNCIGQHLALIETKIILVHMIRNYVFGNIRDPIWCLKLTYGVDSEYEVLIKERQ